ncbi:Cysteine rich receptor like kinase [Parasponia andersonii]|uniref:Cysteine rich receptor like kinase n=1 Tax=Parasponia andersonii TaxID=3476 RepID=A0A2P5BIE3_PARAD|nr:Cysteine rich receptor like kinase [Parasponia andersonii]
MKSLSYYAIFLLFLSSINQLFYLTEAQIFMYKTCNTSANFTSGSVYDQNLKFTLTSLISNASLSGFNVTTVGQNPDLVYGLLQCRGDISVKDCQTCAKITASTIRQNCSNQKEASIAYDNCEIQYSDRRFFSTVNSDQRQGLYNVENTTEPELFNRWLDNLVRNLSSNAASDPSRFAVGSTNYTDVGNKLYAMLQCTRDLSEKSCLTCLEDITGYIPRTCGGKVGCQIYSMSCNLRYEIYPFSNLIEQSPPPQAAPIPPSLEPNLTTTTSTNGTKHEGKKSTKKTIAAVTITVIMTLVALPIICACLVWMKARRKADDDGVHEDGTGGMESLLIGLRTLKVATKNFSNANKLGEGGFGPVYKGKLYDGQEIAVKRLSSNSVQGLEELITEVTLVAKLLHRNLVRLLGFCLEDEEKLLVYEFLPNGSLDKVLFDEGRQFGLDWERRYKIIVGIARGLLYLHEDSQFRIIHCDLKASNILLDEDMNPKISDFGLAKLFCGSQIQGKTNRISGTFGYMAPEYAKNGSFSTKSDVYSFGILVLEIITGRKNSSFRRFTNLQSHAWRRWANGTPLELMDPSLDDQWPRHEALKCIHVGLLCVQEAATERPRMSEVVMMLNSYTVSSPAPSRPAFFISDSEDRNPEILVRQDSVVSEYDVTITELHPRD